MGIKSCNNHPTLSAVIHCSQCHKPICERCVVNGRFCSQQCNDKFGQFYKTYQGGAKRTSGLMRLLQTLGSVVFLGGGGYVIYLVLRSLGVIK